MRRTLARTVSLAIVIALLVSATAFAQGAFSPLPAAAPDTTPTAGATTTTATSSQGGLKHWQEILMFLGGVGLIAGISWAILSDARRVAPVTAAEAAGHGSSAGVRKAQQKQQARKKAKAQRAARKRNRR
jgi:hypothetical protein